MKKFKKNSKKLKIKCWCVQQDNNPKYTEKKSFKRVSLRNTGCSKWWTFREYL